MANAIHPVDEFLVGLDTFEEAESHVLSALRGLKELYRPPTEPSSA